METNYTKVGPAIASAMVKVQASLKTARKVKENPHLKSKYADLGSVWEACHEALTENKVAVIQPFAFENGVMFLETILIHESGEMIVGRYMMRPVKEDPQAYGSAGSYARRYSLAAMVGIIQDDDDGSRASTRGKTANTEKVSNPGKLSAVQKLALSKACKANGWTPEAVGSYLADKFEYASTADITLDKYPEILTAFSNKPPVN